MRAGSVVASGRIALGGRSAEQVKDGGAREVRAAADERRYAAWVMAHSGESVAFEPRPQGESARPVIRGEVVQGSDLSNVGRGKAIHPPFRSE